MDIKLDYSITVNEFLEMVESVGWNTYTKEQIKKALQNTMYMVKATVGEKKMQIELPLLLVMKLFMKKQVLNISQTK